MKAKYIAIISALCMMASCAEDKFDVNPTPGKEVRIAAGISPTQTRTLYGVDDGSIKVKWVDSDLISVFSSECTSGRQQAEYKVVAQNAANQEGQDTNTPHQDDGQNYADRLEKTGDYGIQWGSEETSDFYAIYPSMDDTKFSVNDGVVSVNASIRSQQNNVFSKDANGNWIGTPYVNDRNNLTMPDATMYAYKPNVKNGDAVDLTFKPFTTVLKFYIQGWEAVGDDADISKLESIQVQQITLKAPYEIAGDFNLTLGENVKATPGNTATDEITVYAVESLGSYLTLGKNNTIEFSVFTIPVTDRALSDQATNNGITEEWTVTLKTVGNGTFTLKLKPADGKTAPLSAGMVHRVKFPQLPISVDEPLLPEQWISQIPRNVYLSELSVPGTWYSTDANYQTETDLTKQYAAGIRAFHIDCRVSTDTDEIGSISSVTDKNMVLACAGTESYSYVPLRGWNTTIGKTVKAAIDDISTAFDGNTEEYVVVVLSIAEKPWTRGGLLDGYRYGVNDPATVLKYISDMITTNASIWNLYTDEISPDTTVGDVLGHIIIKVNVNTTADKFTGDSYTVPSMLLSEASMCSNSEYKEGDIVYGTFSKMQERTMYWGKAKSDLTYYYHQAQLTLNDNTNNITSGTPSFKDRKDAIDDIIDQSKEIYDNNLHNAWFQMGIGGYVFSDTDGDGQEDDEDRATVASVMNPYLKGKIDAKIAIDPSPVGIVLMNYATTTGADLITTIINMNEQFHLNRDTNKEEWPNTRSSVPTTNGAYALVGDDAF